MTVRQLIPEDLAQIAPGPELGVLLGGLNIATLSGTDLVEVLRARARQLSHEQAQLLAAMVEVGLCDPNAEPDGVALLTRLPAVFTALDTGVICRSKAWLFTELCAELTDEQVQVVCQRLLPDADRLTTGELAARIKKLAIALDPEWAARRYASAVRDRDVIGYLDEDGTATVTGRKLPADQATAACARIEDLAKAAKRAGHPGRVGELRADIYVGLLEGRWQHLTRDQIIADLLTRTVPEASEAPYNTAGGEQPGPNEPGAAQPGTAQPKQSGTAQPKQSGTAQPKQSGTAQPMQSGTAQRVGVEVRVGLSTLLGHDRHPAEIPGWGPVTVETARSIVAALRTGEWRYAILDTEGQLILAEITRRRPVTPESTRSPAAGPGLAPRRGGIVELHIPAVLLIELAAHPDDCGEWAAVIADLAAQYAVHRTEDIQVAQGAPKQNPAARFAGAVLRRYIQIRDRVCMHPGCRCPARAADLDHTIDHARDGDTTDANQGPACRHDHRLKHVGGWRLSQPEPGNFA